MYHNLLVSGENMEGKRKDIVECMLYPRSPIALADLSGMRSICLKDADNSHFNVLSAMISTGLALKAASKNEVGIIVPYHAQAKLINAMAKDLLISGYEMKGIISATVHQFQGSEKDIIIYDAVDCYIQRFPGTLLTQISNNYANRLFNVALTRAKGKFVSVVNIDYMNRKGLSGKLIFKTLLERYNRPVLCAKNDHLISLLSSIDDNKCFKIYSQTDGDRVFLRDIENAAKEIRIDISGELSGTNSFIRELTEALQNARDKGVKVLIRIDKKDSLPFSLKEFAAENNNVFQTIAVIDQTISWLGEPHSIENFIIEEELLETKSSLIVRFAGASTSKMIYRLLEMRNTFDYEDYH